MACPMANDPPFARLNHFAADLGIPRESIIPRIGIRCPLIRLVASDRACLPRRRWRTARVCKIVACRCDKPDKRLELRPERSRVLPQSSVRNWGSCPIAERSTEGPKWFFGVSYRERRNDSLASQNQE